MTAEQKTKLTKIKAQLADLKPKSPIPSKTLERTTRDAIRHLLSVGVIYSKVISYIHPKTKNQIEYERFGLQLDLVKDEHRKRLDLWKAKQNNLTESL